MQNDKRMNRFILIAALLLATTGIKAQDLWEVPEDNSASVKTETKNNKAKPGKAATPVVLKDAGYLSGAVTEKDGKVAWTFDYKVKGKSAQEIYDTTIKVLQKYTGQDNQLEGSKVIMVNKNEHIIVAAVKEWLVFKDAFLSLDRAKLMYTLIARCSDEKLNLSMEKISYRYDDNTGKGEQYISAEEAISDKNALNKKKTKLVPGWARFRKKTVDRKNELFKFIKDNIYLNLAD